MRLPGVMLSSSAVPCEVLKILQPRVVAVICGRKCNPFGCCMIAR